MENKEKKNKRSKYIGRFDALSDEYSKVNRRRSRTLTADNTSTQGQHYNGHTSTSGGKMSTK